MDESLVDGVSLAIVGFGLVSAFLRRDLDGDEPRGAAGWGRLIASHVMLMSAVGLLVTRWVRSVTSLPTAASASDWHSGAKMVFCGMGILAACELALSTSVRRRLGAFVIVCLSATVALLLAGALLWAALSLTVGVWVAWSSMKLGLSTTPNSIELAPSQSREPVLIGLMAGAWLLLMLGTWNHVIELESQRPTRSRRQSAWPQSSALRDAWERTDWLAKLDDENSASRVAESFGKERRIAAGLTLLLVVVAINRRSSRVEEIEDAR